MLLDKNFAKHKGLPSEKAKVPMMLCKILE